MKKEVSGASPGLDWVFTWPYLLSGRFLGTISKSVELSEHFDLFLSFIVEFSLAGLDAPPTCSQVTFRRVVLLWTSLGRHGRCVPRMGFEILRGTLGSASSSIEAHFPRPR